MTGGREGGHKQRQFTISIINVTSAQQHNAWGQAESGPASTGSAF